MKINKTILLYIILMFQIGCSQKLTLDRINAPSKKYFHKELKEQNKPYKDSPDIVKSSNERENMYFDIRLGHRDKVLKEINFENQKKIIIIDKLRTNYAGLVEENFIFTDSDDIYTNIIQSSEDDTVRIIKKKNLKLDKIDEDVLKVYQNFNSNDVDSINKDFKNQFDMVAMPTFYVTVIKNGKVKYYNINLETGYKVVEIN